MVATSKTMVSSLCFSHFQWQTVFHRFNPSFHINLCWVSAWWIFFPCRAEDLFPALRGRIGHGALQYGELQCVALPHPSAGLALRVGWLWCDRRGPHRSGGARRGDGVEFEKTWGLKNGGWTVIEWCYNSDLMGIDCWSKWGCSAIYHRQYIISNVSENNGDTPKLAIQIMKMTNDNNKLKLRVFHFRTDPSEYISVTKRGLLQPTRGKW